MIKKLTNHILSYLISSNAIDDNEETKDYYRYGIEITISSLINILLIIIIGIVSGNALESIVFLACFIPLRQFTGGFHAKTYFLCNLSFAVSFIILLIVYKFTNQNVYSCCNWCLSQLNAERMILINGDLKKIFAGGITYEKVIQKNRCFYYGSISNCSWSSQHDGKCL